MLWCLCWWMRVWQHQLPLSPAATEHQTNAPIAGICWLDIACCCRVTAVLILMSIEPPPPISQTQMAVPVVIMCCREVTMSALREWAASAGGAAHKASGCRWEQAIHLITCQDHGNAHSTVLSFWHSLYD
eukprot:GHRQ01030319.1.p2 GENE.GHRQ01030319.1~~GHRQ01030319.1.p2  ORF type:complete len:130 (-),score=22.50 GHRQ01030319.1:27-416(-)